MGYPLEAIPRLDSARCEGTLRLGWPAWATDFALYTATNLAAPVVWTVVTNAVGVSNGVYVLPLPATPGQQFYRLGRR